MPKISIEHQSSIPADQALAAIKNFFETDKFLANLDPGIQCQISTAEGKAKVISSKFKAEVTVQAKEPGCLLKVQIDLPLLFTPFKSKVEETIKAKLGKYLA